MGGMKDLKDVLYLQVQGQNQVQKELNEIGNLNKSFQDGSKSFYYD